MYTFRETTQPFLYLPPFSTGSTLVKNLLLFEQILCFRSRPPFSKVILSLSRKPNKAQFFKTNYVVCQCFVKISFKNLKYSNIFLLKKCKKLLHCSSFSHFFNKNISVFGYKIVKHLMTLLSYQCSEQLGPGDHESCSPLKRWGKNMEAYPTS